MCSVATRWGSYDAAIASVAHVGDPHDALAEVDLSCSEWRFWILPKPPKTKLVRARRDVGEYGDVLNFTGGGVCVEAA